jgi:hypothetical protein
MLLIYHGYKALLNVGRGSWSLTLNASLSDKFLSLSKQLFILWESIHGLEHQFHMYYGMVKPLPIMLCKPPPGKLIRVSLVMHPT